MTLIRMVVASLVSVAGLSAAGAEPSLQDRKQAACFEDVQRLCGQFIPDADKVTDCMKDKRPKVNKLCSTMWNVK